MSSLQIIGLLIAILFIAGMAIYSGTRVKKGSENNNGAGVIAGVIMGTLVGGSSTVGTAQLAYNFGMSAWWFTLGGGLACLVLTLVYCVPFRKSGCATLVGMLSKEYGPKVGMTASVLNSVGTFINIISQLLAASAVLLVVLPNTRSVFTVVIAAVFMVLYVIFGGTKGAGMVGVIKLVLLYVSMVFCGLIALGRIGGTTGLFESVAVLKAATGIPYLSLFARGAGTDLGSCFSLILGVLTTQTYAQAVMSGKSDRAARTGGLISAILIPPIGIFGIIVGLYMRTITDPATFDAKTALTTFVLQYLPDLPSGIVLGTLFVASVGTGAGLALGIATIINKDIINKVTTRFASEKKGNLLQKLLIILVLMIGCLMSNGSLGDTILNFAFMSMGLRGAVVFLPMCFAIWAKNKVRSGYVMASCIVSPILVLLFGTIWKGILPVDSLFAGLLASVVIMIIGFAVGKKSK